MLEIGAIKDELQKNKKKSYRLQLEYGPPSRDITVSTWQQKSFELPANPGLLKNAPRISDSVSHPSTEAWRLGMLHSSPGTQTRKKKEKHML